MKKLILFSGGPDSTAMTYLLKERYEDLHLIILADEIKAKNCAELKAARKIASVLNLPYKEFDISSLNSLLDGLPNVLISLGSGGEKKSDFAYGEEGAPLSSQLLHTLAAIHGIANGFDCMFWGVHKGDDLLAGKGWLKEYITRFNSILQHSGFSFKLEAPYLNYTKAQLVKEAYEKGAPIELTFSCITPGVENHCGVCRACIERDKVFKSIGIQNGSAVILEEFSAR